MERYYNNNKNNKEFQKLVYYVNSLLSIDILDYMNNTLRSHIKQTYKTTLLKKYNTKINEMNLKLQRNVKLLKEIMDHIDFVNYLRNDITKFEMLRMKSSCDITKYRNDRFNILLELINTNEETREIMNELHIENGIIQNITLRNKILLTINEYNKTLYLMNFGITSYNKETKIGIEKVGVLPFDDSGRFPTSFDNYENLGLIVLYCYNKVEKYEGLNKVMYKSGYKSRLNYIYKNKNLELIDKGINNLRKTCKKYICYRMIKSEKLTNRINALKYKAYKFIESKEKQQTTTKHITRHIKPYMLYKLFEISKKADFIVSYDITENKVKYNNKDIKLNFDYNNKSAKTYRYNKYVSNMKIKHYCKGYMIFYPYYKNDTYLYCSFGHLMNAPPDPLSDIKDQTKLGNIRNEYIFRQKMNDSMYNLIWIMSGKTNLKQLLHLKNKKEIKTKLIELLNYAVNQNMLNNNLKTYFIQLITTLKDKIKLRINHITKLSQKELNLKEIYFTYDNKRTKKAKHIKRQFTSIENNVNKQIRMIDILKLQQVDAYKFFTHVFNRIEITDISDMIRNVFVSQIRLYNTKVLVRYVNTQRSMLELIKLGINNINYDLTYELDKPIIQNKVEFHYNNKFEELLNYSNNDVVITKFSDQTCIPIKSLLKILVKMNFIYDDAYLRNYMIYHMYKITRKYQNLESNILNT